MDVKGLEMAKNNKQDCRLYNYDDYVSHVLSYNILL